MDGLCQQRLETFWWTLLKCCLLCLHEYDSLKICGKRSALAFYIYHVYVCACMVWLRYRLPRGNEVSLEVGGGGQSSICSNPSSCHCLPLGCSLLMAATCQRFGWVLPEWESRRQESGSLRNCRMTSIKPPLLWRTPLCEITSHVRCETLSGAAALIWNAGNLQQLQW